MALPCEERQCFQAGTLHPLCSAHFQPTDMLSKFSKQQLWCLQSITHQLASQAFSYLRLFFFFFFQQSIFIWKITCVNHQGLIRHTLHSSEDFVIEALLRAEDPRVQPSEGFKTV